MSDLTPISDDGLTNLSLKEVNKFLKGRSDEKHLRDRRATLKRKQSSIKTRSKQKEAMKEYEGKRKKIASTPKDWMQASLKHREKFERLLKVWGNAESSAKVTSINDNGVIFEEEFSIGSGSYGTKVYICLGFDGIERAIKRLPKQLCQKFLKNERDILNSPNAVESPRIVNYCFYDEISNNDFGYLILNLYEQNLEEFIKEKGETITESRARKMIRQILEGLEALHGREPRILHRDLKPTNILVDKNGDLVLSDFGIGRFFPEQGATTYHTSHASGSHGWVAYECIDWGGLFSDVIRSPSAIQFRWKEKSDIQVAGMLSFYIVTKGKHPFGPKIAQLMNLHADNPVGLKELSESVVKDLFSQMLARELDKRPYVEQALKHPYFLSLEEQMKFVAAVGNESEIKRFKPDPCAVSSELDNRHPSKPRSSLLPNDWKAAIDPDDLNTFCAGGPHLSSYDGNRYTHCLRLIRNVRQHWGDIRPRPPLKGMGQATSIEEYFLQLFPTLPLVLHQIIREHPDWKTRPTLKEFFPMKNRRTGSDAD